MVYKKDFSGSQKNNKRRALFALVRKFVESRCQRLTRSEQCTYEDCAVQGPAVSPPLGGEHDDSQWLARGQLGSRGAQADNQRMRGDGISQKDLSPFAAIGTGIFEVLLGSPDDRLLGILGMEALESDEKGERDDEIEKRQFQRNGGRLPPDGD